MNIYSGTLQLYAFDNDMQSGITYTINVPEDCLITEYKLKFKKGASAHNITISDDTTTLTPSSTSEQTFTATNLSTTSVSFNLTGTLANNFIKVTSFVVTIQREGGASTDIDLIEFTDNNQIYDLRGQKLENITEPGIYIINGKKILKK